MNKQLFLLILSFLALSGSVIGQTFNAAGTPAPIPDPGNVNLSVTVSGLGGTVATADEVQLNLNINHEWASDIVVGITPPGGTEILIVNRIGGGVNFDMVSGNTLSFRSNASGIVPTPSTTGVVPAGVYLPTGSAGKPVGSFSSLIGATRDGTWNIRVRDDDGIMAGTVEAASITFFGLAPSCIPALAPTISASTNTACAGTQVTLTAVAPMGLSIAEYLWSKNGTPVNYQNGGTGTYTVNAGTVAASNDYTLEVVYLDSGCLSLSSAPATIVTNTQDAIITPSGATTYCAGTPFTLNANTGVGLTYQWKRGGTLIQIGGTSYTPTVTGNHRVIVTNALGCSQASEWVSVTVNALPVANAGTDKLVCLGSSVQIGSANNAANTYTWWPITGLSNPYISNPIAAATPMTYTVTVTNATTGCSRTDAVIVSTIGAPPTPSITSTPSGSMVNLTVNSPSATSVNWYKNGALLYSNKAPNSSILVAPSSPTQAYTAKSKGTNGCLSSFSNVINTRIGDDKGGDEVIEVEDAMMQAYPNPTSGLLNIAISVKDMNTGKLAIYNALGQSVFASDVNLFAGQANIELDMSSFAAGIYTLSFQTENGNYIQKVVKE